MYSSAQSRGYQCYPPVRRIFKKVLRLKPFKDVERKKLTPDQIMQRIVRGKNLRTRSSPANYQSMMSCWPSVQSGSLKLHNSKFRKYQLDSKLAIGLGLEVHLVKNTLKSSSTRNSYILCGTESIRARGPLLIHTHLAPRPSTRVYYHVGIFHH